MKRSLRAGRVETQQGGREGYGAFIPARLPPSPAVALDEELQTLLERASRALGRLDGISLLLPDPRLFLYMYVRKEAVLSSQIEGTESSLSDLLLFENNEIPAVGIDDVREVSNYIAAMEYGLERLRNGFPLSLRLIREIHGILMENARGGDKTPGEFRRSQNWIGGSRPGNARFVPPPPHELMASLDNLEKFLHGQNSVPLLVKAGLAHAQFETIHPFLDGNGRIGRLLITFLLCAEGALTQPLLYLSLYLRERRDEYYESLQRIRTEGDWEGWLRFYLRGVESVAVQATATTRKIVQLFEADRQSIQGIGKGASSALRVHELLKERPILSIAATVGALKMTKPTAASAMENLEALNIVREESGRRRDRHYVYRRYINVLDEGTQ
jgi:cell filamentation protein, protein adenylyltransferase